MRRVTVATFAALCVIGASSLAFAAEGKKYGDQIEPGTKAAEGAKYGDQMETGKLSQEPSVLGITREPVRPNDAMKGKEKEHKEKKKEHKEKMTTH